MADPFFYSCAIAITPALSAADARLFDALSRRVPCPEGRAILSATENEPDAVADGSMGLLSLNPGNNGFKAHTDDGPDLLAAWLRPVIRHFFIPRGYSVGGRIAWIEANDSEASGCIFVKEDQVEVIEDEWLLNPGPSWGPAVLADDELKSALNDLIKSADATGCSDDLVVVSSHALERLRRHSHWT